MSEARTLLQQSSLGWRDQQIVLRERLPDLRIRQQRAVHLFDQDEIRQTVQFDEDDLPIIGEADIYGQKVPMTRLCGFPPTEKASGDFEEMSLLAGESVGQTNELLGVEEIVTAMMSDAAAIIRKRLGAMVAGN